jgi:hypothetical protein
MPKVRIFNSWNIPSIDQNVILLGLIWLLRSLTQNVEALSTDVGAGSPWPIDDTSACQTLWFHSFLYNI